jgi:hypothetical protein
MIVMIDYAPAQARFEGEVTARHRRGGLPGATVAKVVTFSPPPTFNEVDRLYHQQAEIHAIGDGVAQLAECARWCHSTSTSSPV